jgi:surfeit locus 1 family protein
MKPRIWPILLASGLGLVLLLSLGVWQVQRLAWKNALIANFENTKTTVTGRFSDVAPLRFLSSAEGGPAWQLLQAFDTTEGQKILVSRGKIPQGITVPVMSNAELTLVGHLQNHDKGRGFFDVDNNPAGNVWYYWDVNAMLGQPVKDGAVLHLVPGSPGTDGLIVEPPKAELRNNHLGYAITWFGLAAVLVVMTGLFIRTRVKPS